jgi:RNA polymerase subunit RPABC4/transcription elongation factor Spt4
MSFWDDLSRKVSQGTRTLSQKSVELFEIAKVKLDIASEKDKIGNLYEEIGRVIYQDYRKGNLKEKSVLDKCQLIDEIYYKINRLNRKVMQIKGGTLCKRCGEAVNASQRYCHMCGRELEQPTRVVGEGEDFRVEVLNGSVCGKCGALIQQGSEFCPSCGDKL